MSAASATGDRRPLLWTSLVVCYALVVLFPIFWMASMPRDQKARSRFLAT
jgi:hypothetical protein